VWDAKGTPARGREKMLSSQNLALAFALLVLVRPAQSLGGTCGDTGPKAGSQNCCSADVPYYWGSKILNLQAGRVTKLGVNFRAIGPVRLALYTETGVVTLPALIAQTNEYTAQIGENEFPVRTPVDINAGQYRVVAQGSLIDHAQESTSQGWYKPGVTPFIDFTPNLVGTNRAYPYSSLSWVVQECFSGEACQGTTCVCPTPTCDAHPFCGVKSNACGNNVNCNANCRTGENCQGSTCVCPTPACDPFPYCGTKTNACSGSRDCSGQCTNPYVCNGAQEQCECAASSCQAHPYCGIFNNSCGFTTNCQFQCQQDEACVNDACVCQEPVW
jgi:hypothetical protein